MEKPEKSEFKFSENRVGIENLEKSTLTGVFMLPSGEEVPGKLVLSKQKSCLQVWNEQYPREQYPREQSIKVVRGFVNDLGQVSLFNCMWKRSYISYIPDKGRKIYIYNSVFSIDYAVFGPDHIHPDEKKINRVGFLVEDANVLFHDPYVFGTVTNVFSNRLDPNSLAVVADPRPLVRQVVQSDSHYAGRGIEVNEHAAVLCYTGKNKVFETDTLLGRVSAGHEIDFSLGYEVGKMERKTYVSLRFANEVDFYDAVRKALRILRFLELLSVCPQNLKDFQVVEPEDVKGLSRSYRVYAKWFPDHERLDDRLDEPEFLIDAVLNPQEFSLVLANWLKRDEDWRDARDRLFSCLAKQVFDMERLIAAANMFDILPVSAIPREVDLAEDIKSARDRCRESFRELPESPERDSVLATLGRVGKSSLRSKINHRARYVIDEIEDDVPDLLKVIKEAVTCRNYYVHGVPGGEPRMDYQESGIMAFLTRTLEFVFVASDLVEAGWDIVAWRGRTNFGDNPFNRYINEYRANLEKLGGLLDKS